MRLESYVQTLQGSRLETQAENLGYNLEEDALLFGEPQSLLFRPSVDWVTPTPTL